MSETEYKNLLRSVSTFLKNEAEIFGRFQVPAVHELMLNRSTSNPSNIKPSQNDIQSPEEKHQRKVVASNKTGHILDNRSDATEIKSRNSESLLKEVRTLDELRAVCEKCEDLRTDLKDTHLVFGTGNPNADLMLIGEAPGAQEDLQGEPFVGKAGQLLNKILAAVSFQRKEVYIANILKHRPPNNRDPLPEERHRSLPYLYRQIDLIQPRLILCLGRISAQTLLDTNQAMKNLRGQFHSYRNGIELMVTFHPAALLRNPSWKRDTWEDVQLLRKRYDELTTGKQ
ncbi:MAG: uracil-DNA glycosylase [Balneolales bacterium]